MSQAIQGGTFSESDLEKHLIEKLEDLKYEYRPDIRSQAELEYNFREKFEALNCVSLTDSEFQRLLDEIVKSDVYEAARSLRNLEAFIRDDGTPLNYTLVNIDDWCKNTFEVINQIRINTDNSHHRYDVTLLINGIPTVQIELKTLQISPRRAMEQIVNYKNDLGNGYTRTLMCFVQIFIVSNRTETWYFANNNINHFTFDAEERFLPVYQFADEENIKISHLDDFADRFLPKCTLGQMVSKYMVLVESEKKLLIMRPYQIYAVKAIMNCIDQNSGNGYVWHTTGSGKTLTSFKASTLLKNNKAIHKCLFVVDRKDLDRQTREEFNRFQENCVEENTNTASLVTRLLSEDYADKVIVTTIQKLGLALGDNKYNKKSEDSQGKSKFKQRLQALQEKRMVFIFDECHRSQFGENHKAIKEFFPNSQLFGFTGTPIFEKNATVRKIRGEVATLQTTKDLFQKKLHAYTITNAIEDQIVLRFHVDYYKQNDDRVSSEILDKRAVVLQILEKHDKATSDRLFNSIFATASINDAIEYFKLFEKVQADKQSVNPNFVPLKIAAVFSPPAEGNKDVQQIQEELPQEKADNRQDPEGKKSELKAIISEYNEKYNTNHDINSFDLYYQDVQQRIKDHKFPNGDLPKKGQEKIDVTIVVDMLLTGFDATFLNTLYVDKNFRHHGLIQAFSRTNRVFNTTKPYGHVIDFRQQNDSVDAAIALFSGVQPEQAREIWLVEKASVVINKFEKAVNDIDKFMLSQGLEFKPDQVIKLKGDDARFQFIKRFKEVQRLSTALNQYTDLKEAEYNRIEKSLPSDEIRAFRGAYIETVKRLKEQHMAPEGSDESNNHEFNEFDFELALFASALIDYDYIMKLIAKYSNQDPQRVQISRENLIGLIQSDAKFYKEREEITEFVHTLKVGEGLDENEIRAGYERFKEERQTNEIEDLATKHGLSHEALLSFVNFILQRMIFDGEQLTDLMEPLQLGWRKRRDQELSLMAELVPILNKRACGREISGLKAYENELAP